MKEKVLVNGFYWVIVQEYGDQPEVAEYFNGEWYVVGSSNGIESDDKLIKVLTTRLPSPLEILSLGRGSLKIFWLGGDECSKFSRMSFL